MTTNRFCEITHELQHLSKLSEQCARIDPALYAKYDVKRGLRDINGKGVLVGLTEISDVCSTKMIDGKLRPADGELYYRGYNVKDIIDGTMHLSASFRKTSYPDGINGIYENAQ